MANKHKSPAARALQEARKALGLTLEDAARELSKFSSDTTGPRISSSQLSRIETGSAYITQERLEQLADLYGLSVPELLDGQVVKAASRMDLQRLKDVVAFVQQVVIDLQAQPSATKMSDAITMVYERETEWALTQTDLKTSFDPDRHRQFVETAFRK